MSPSNNSIATLKHFLEDLDTLPYQTSQERYIAYLKRRQIRGSRSCAIATVRLIQRLVTELDAITTVELPAKIKDVGVQIIAGQPKEVVIGNVIRRALGLVGEVTEPAPNSEIDDLQAVARSHTLVAANGAKSLTQNDANDSSAQKLKDDVLDGLAEMLDEINAADAQIAEFSHEQIQSNETVLTCGSSLCVQKFLARAVKRTTSKAQRMTLLQTESYPNENDNVHDAILHGVLRTDRPEANQELRLRSLSDSGMNVVAISDSSIYAVMPRVTRVILPAQAIFCDGSFTSAVGAKVVAQAAKLHHVPVVVLGAIYKLSPLYPFNAGVFAQYGDAGKCLDFRESSLLHGLGTSNPMNDFVPSRLADLIITNIGSHAPSFMGRIASDHYRQEDVDLTG